MRVELCNVKFRAFHGLYDFERENGGDFLVDVLIETPDLPEYTTLPHVVNYEDIYAIMKRQMEQPQLFIEEVARVIKQDLSNLFPNAACIRVSITKCAPPINGMQGFAKVTL